MDFTVSFDPHDPEFGRLIMIEKDGGDMTSQGDKLALDVLEQLEKDGVNMANQFDVLDDEKKNSCDMTLEQIEAIEKETGQPVLTDKHWAGLDRQDDVFDKPTRDRVKKLVQPQVDAKLIDNGIMWRGMLMHCRGLDPMVMIDGLGYHHRFCLLGRLTDREVFWVDMPYVSLAIDWTTIYKLIVTEDDVTIYVAEP